MNPAFVALGASSFVSSGQSAVATSHVRGKAIHHARTRHAPLMMAKGGNDKAGVFSEPQPGDPGYKAPTGAKAKKSPPPEAGKEVKPSASIGGPGSASFKKQEKRGFVSTLSDMAQSAKETVSSFAQGNEEKRGLELLKDDILRNAPERVGVGRQDAYGYMEPQFGEPGYVTTEEDKPVIEQKKPTDQKASPRRAEYESKTYRMEPKSSEPEVYDIPDYLKPLSAKESKSSTSWQSTISGGKKASGANSGLPDYLRPIEEDQNNKPARWTND